MNILADAKSYAKGKYILCSAQNRLSEFHLTVILKLFGTEGNVDSGVGLIYGGL
jgi:hypothetical protein